MSKHERKQNRARRRRAEDRRRFRLSKLRRADQETTLKYSEVRGQINAGDLLLFQGDQALSWVIRWVTHGGYSHSALVVPAWSDRLLVMQAEAQGVEIVPASHAVDQYNGRVDWWALADEARPLLKEKAFLDAVLEPVGKPYDFRGAFWLGLLRLLHSKARPPTRRVSSYFCSDYVAEALGKSGIDTSGLDAKCTAPSDFARCGLFVYKGTLHIKDPALPAPPEVHDPQTGMVEPTAP
jgi:hypothetical protein